jgi:hypothetical protein
MERIQYVAGMVLGLMLAVFIITGGARKLAEMPMEVLVPTAIVTMGFVGVVNVRRHRWAKAMEEGARRLEAGDFSGGASCFEAALHRAPRRRERIAATYQLGLCHHLAGEGDRALGVLEPLSKKGGTWEVPAIHASLPVLLSVCLSLKGDTSAARHQLAEAERIVGVGPHAPLLLPEVLLLCREGHCAAALRTLELRSKEAEAGDVRSYKLLRLLRAYALSELGTADSKDIASALAGLQSYSRGDFDHLGTHWPRMSAFLDSHGLLGRPKAA